MDEFRIDPSKLPIPIEIEIPANVGEWLERTSTKTGRTQEELILELLDKALGEY